MKISSDTGLAFFIRTTYLKHTNPDDIIPDAQFFDEYEEDIIDAGMAYSAECKALDYLGRAEQSRFGLTQKLIRKNFEKKYIETALDYLTQKNYLSDYRFTRAWLSSRKINHFEGKTRLLAELLSRNVQKDAVNLALTEFFEENSEEDLCLRAIEKFKRNGKKDEKLVHALLGAGFPYSMIKNLLG